MKKEVPYVDIRNRSAVRKSALVVYWFVNLCKGSPYTMVFAEKSRVAIPISKLTKS